MSRKSLLILAILLGVFFMSNQVHAWNPSYSSWQKRVNVTFSDPLTNGNEVNRILEPLESNITGLTLVNCSELRILNNSCASDGGTEQIYQIISNNTSNSNGNKWCKVVVEVNKTAETNAVWCAYYNYSSATDPAYSTPDSNFKIIDLGSGRVHANNSQYFMDWDKWTYVGFKIRVRNPGGGTETGAEWCSAYACFDPRGTSYTVDWNISIQDNTSTLKRRWSVTNPTNASNYINFTMYANSPYIYWNTTYAHASLGIMNYFVTMATNYYMYNSTYERQTGNSEFTVFANDGKYLAIWYSSEKSGMGFQNITPGNTISNKYDLRDHITTTAYEELWATNKASEHWAWIGNATNNSTLRNNSISLANKLTTIIGSEENQSAGNIYNATFNANSKGSLNNYLGAFGFVRFSNSNSKQQMNFSKVSTVTRFNNINSEQKMDLFRTFILQTFFNIAEKGSNQFVKTFIVNRFSNINSKGASAYQRTFNLVRFYNVSSEGINNFVRNFMLESKFNVNSKQDVDFNRIISLTGMFNPSLKQVIDFIATPPYEIFNATFNIFSKALENFMVYIRKWEEVSPYRICSALMQIEDSRAYLCVYPDATWKVLIKGV